MPILVVVLQSRSLYFRKMSEQDFRELITSYCERSAIENSKFEGLTELLEIWTTKSNGLRFNFKSHIPEANELHILIEK